MRRTVWLGFLDLDGELLEPGDAAPQELVDALDDAVHVRERRAPGGVRPGRVVRGGGGRELDVDAADDARVVLWPEARARERCEALDARELRRAVSVCTREGGERDGTKEGGGRRTSEMACWMLASRSERSSARTLPVSITSGMTLAAMRIAMKSDAMGSKPVQP